MTRWRGAGRRHRVGAALLSLAPLAALAPLACRRGDASHAGRDADAASVSARARSADRVADLVADLVAGPPRELRGTCDASAAVALDARTLVVANDEDDVLRVYDLDAPDGRPVDSLPLAPLFALPGRTRGADEADLEAVARIGDTLWWIGSHANHRTGRELPARRVLLATVARRDGGRWRLAPAGRVYRRLRDDLVADSALRALGLAAAAARPPEPAGLNVEGLAPGPAGTLLVGLRSPVVGGAALVVRVAPGAIRTDAAARARVLGVDSLDLRGHGVRAIERTEDGSYVVAAGPPDDAGRTTLHGWTPGRGAPRALVVTGLPRDMKVEAVAAVPGDGRALLLVADDGGRRVDGRECKSLATRDAASRARMRFRVVRAAPPPPGQAPGAP